MIPSDMVAFMTESNIQHVQIDNSPDGLLLLVNGEPVPFIKWDGDTLQNTAGLVNELGAGMPVLEQLLPLATSLGLGLIIRFPLAEGADAIPTYVEGGESAVAAQAAQSEFMAAVGDTPPTLTIPVFYDADGGWRVGDLTDAEWSSLTSLPFQAARLIRR